VALATIAFLMQLVRRMSFLPFVIYRIRAGVVLLALIFWGVPLGAGYILITRRLGRRSLSASRPCLRNWPALRLAIEIGRHDRFDAAGPLMPRPCRVRC
jgi:hypothetical protein